MRQISFVQRAWVKIEARMWASVMQSVRWIQYFLTKIYGMKVNLRHDSVSAGEQDGRYFMHVMTEAFAHLSLC